MIRLLIVDNERLIVESLLDLFEHSKELEVEAFGAYSGKDALELLGRIKFDIVLSDIRMPGMDGLELQKEIVKQWPWCKIIFLSGYDDFEYIQQVMRNGGVDYLLKTEGHDAVLRSVEHAVAQLYAAVESEQLIRNAERQMQLARPLLWNEYLLEVLQGEAESAGKMERRFAELRIPLRLDGMALLAIGRVDDWRDDLSVADRELMLYAIRNIAEEYFAKSANCLTVRIEKNKLLWILQSPVPGDEADARTLRFIQGTVETIQIACKQLLKLCVSIAAAGEMRGWEDVPEQFGALKRLLGRGLGMGKELILFDRSGLEGAAPGVQTHEVRSQLEKLSAMAAFLENGQRERFFAEYSKLTGLVDRVSKPDEPLRLEIYYSLSALFLSYMNRWGVHDDIGGKIDLGKLTKYDAHRTWDEADEYLAALAARLFEQKHADHRYSEDDLIKHIQWYVKHNLADDLSLTRIGEVVGYHPYYVTRLYKRITNESLTDYIADVRLSKAKHLLSQGQMSVHDISKAIGFMTEQSFYRFFKKAVSLTPQEYRDRHEKSKNGNGK